MGFYFYFFKQNSEAFDANIMASLKFTFPRKIYICTVRLMTCCILTKNMKCDFSLLFFSLLRALALSDLCVMVSGALLYGLPGISSTYSHDIQPKISPYLLPMAQTSIMTSVYLAVLMSFERYIRICFTCQLRPFRCITEKNLT